MNTVIGVIADENSMAFDPLQHRTAWSSAASEYRSEQPRRIPVDFDHSHVPVGQVVHLERHRGVLWALAEVDALPAIPVRVGDETILVEHPLYFSAERVGTADDKDLVLRGLALTRTPARAGAHPLTWFAGPLSNRGSWLHNKRQLDGHLAGLVTRANDTRHTRHGGPLIVHDTQPLAGLTRLARGGGYTGGYVDADGELVPVADRSTARMDTDDPAPGAVWHRPCGPVLRVS